MTRLDAIHIRDLMLWAHVGVLDHERRDGQWFSLDITLWQDLSLAAADDFVEMARSADGASGVLHVRAFRGVELGWRTVETMLYPLLDARADEVGFDSQALPDQDQLAAALGTTLWEPPTQPSPSTVSKCCSRSAITSPGWSSNG